MNDREQAAGCCEGMAALLNIGKYRQAVKYVRCTVDPGTAPERACRRVCHRVICADWAYVDTDTR